MISDARLAEIAAAAYDPTVPARWERGDVKVALTVDGGFTILAWRGTVITDPRDIIRDLDCLPRFRAGLGDVHHGFLSGVESVEAQILADTSDSGPLVVTGHSLGAAMALIFGGLLCLIGHPPAAIVTLGSPRLGFATIEGLLKDIPGRDYRHGEDPVTPLPPIFEHPRPLTQLAWEGPAPLDPLEYHAAAGYVRALSG